MRAVIISIVLVTLMAQVLGQETTVASNTPTTILSSSTATPPTSLPTASTSNTTSAPISTTAVSGSSAATWSPAITLIALAALKHRF